MNWFREQIDTRGRGLVTAFLLCILALRVLVPDGYMPVATPTGLVVALCTGEGLVEIHVDVDRDKGQAPASQAPGCHFASAASPWTSPEAPSVPMLFVSGGAPMHVQPLASLVPSRLAAPPPPSIGPPARA